MLFRFRLDPVWLLSSWLILEHAFSYITLIYDHCKETPRLCLDSGSYFHVVSMVFYPCNRQKNATVILFITVYRHLEQCANKPSINLTRTRKIFHTVVPLMAYTTAVANQNRMDIKINYCTRRDAIQRRESTAELNKVAIDT
jgi:hypothetical protein